MEHKDSLLYGLDGSPADESKINTHRTSLDFEIVEGHGESDMQADGPVFTTQADIITAGAPTGETDMHEKPTPAKTEIEHPKEEFSIPDSFEVNERYTTQSFVETPSNLRPTYLPRFTEISDTYRMQDDPRPRPEPQTKPSTVVEKTDSVSSDTDPISESVEEKEIEKVVVTTGIIGNSEPKDESITILKFSTPVDNEIQSAFDLPVEESAVEPVIEEIPAEPEPDPDPVIEEPEERNLTIPDPEREYNVVELSKAGIEEKEINPEGAAGSSAVSEKYNGFEFTSPIQRDAIKDRFLDSIMSIKVRLVGSLIILAFMAIIDIASLLGKDIVASIFGAIPAARAFLDLQLAVCLILLAIPETARAFKMLFSKKCIPELFVPVSFLVLAAGDAVLAFSGLSDYHTYGALFGIGTVLAIIASYFRTRADFDSFKITARNVSKNVLDHQMTRSLQRENMALDGIIDEYNSKSARMFHTAFVSDFFARSSICLENHVNVLMILGISFGASLVTGAASYFLDEFSLNSAMQAFTMVFLMSVPSFSLLSHKLPYRHTAKEASDEDSAFVGESSIYDCADTDVITYDDVEIFGVEDVSIAKYHFYGKAFNSDKAMRQMYSIFSVVGGPLDYVFSSALDRKCPSATDIVIEDDGISGSTDDHRVHAGTEAYMQRHGIVIPPDGYNRSGASSTDSTRVLYCAEDNVVYAKFFIRYSFSEEFTMLLPDLRANKIVPLIYTRDPNITNELIRILTFGEDVIRVMKKYSPAINENRVYRHISSGAVTHGDKMNLVNMVLLAKKYMKLESSLAKIELAAMASGAAIAVVLSVLGIFELPATALAIWQVLWCIVLYVKSKTSFAQKKQSDEEEEYEE